MIFGRVVCRRSSMNVIVRFEFRITKVNKGAPNIWY